MDGEVEGTAMARERMSKKRKRKKLDAGGSFMVSHRPHRAFSACLTTLKTYPRAL